MKNIKVFFNPTFKRNHCFYLVITGIFFIGITQAQTTFTESAALYNLNIAGNKDGGHAWADYDLDGDFDIFINTNNRGHLLRNDGGSFTDVTNTLISDVNNDGLERTVLFVDFNNDGYPDIFRNDSGNARFYLQIPDANPNNIRFGLSNGTIPNQTFNDGNFNNEFNSEGAGALDYDGDGDLDVFIDNHNFGIDILQNDGNGFFTHVTRKADSPNPPYNEFNSSTWPLGLVQDATDGDYGSATDFNDDGWVDIVARKQDQVDLFTNVGGTFQDGVNIDNATNGNKGSVAFGDLDNDGDFDLFWTENGDNQIHRNNGDGTWTAMGAATGFRTNFKGQIEGLAFGDVENDGDLDIFLANGANGNGITSRLFLNQINDGGGAMSFSDSGISFQNRAEGCTFIDIDLDGDLDLYMNRSGANALYLNNLSAASRANHVYIDIQENRDDFGLIGSEERFGIGATVKILDCNGTVISGTREVNGGFGHGTQESGIIHFGLPGGPNTPIVLEVGFPRTSSGRVVVRSQLTPSSFNNGSINLVDILPDVTNLDPTAQDDLIATSQGVSLTFDPLTDNGNGVDTDPENSSLEVIAITQPANGTAILNGDGTITYNPGSFIGSTSFTYTLGDNPICSFASGQDIGTVYVTVAAQPDTDGDGIFDDVDLDDDNDGVLDVDECPSSSGTIDITTVVFNIPQTGGTSTQLVDLSATGIPIGGSVTISNIIATGDLNGSTENFSLNINSGEFNTGLVRTGQQCSANLDPLLTPITTIVTVIDIGFGTPGISILGQTTAGVNNFGSCNGVGYQLDIDGSYSIICTIDTDGDGIYNDLDVDSDGDGCPDAIEAAGNFSYYDLNGDRRLIGGVDSNGVPNIVSPIGQLITSAITDSSIRLGCANTVITNRRVTYRVNKNQ